MDRIASLSRKTKETDISVSLNLDGSGKYDISTGVGFFDHMLQLFACHSGFDLVVACKGDTDVDAHHTVEDIGIVIGKLLNEALGDKRGIARYATAFIPMDEALARCVIDISGRPFLHYNCEINGSCGNFDCELAEEFFRSVCSYGLITMHIESIYGNNRHHIIEGMFKAFAHALADSVKVVSDKIPSSKGVLE